MNYLSRREHSQHELRYKLARHNYSAEDIDVELQRLFDDGLQSDARFVEHYLHVKMLAGYGPRYIEQQLQQRGVSVDLIAHALQAISSWGLVLQRVWSKKYRTLPGSPQEQAKQRRFLLSRGFEPYDISQLIKQLNQNDRLRVMNDEALDE